MNSNYPLTLVEFKSWLESKDENEVAGKVKNGNHCPIANILKEDNKSVFVGDNFTGIDDIEILNPLWVHYFLTSVDSLWETTKDITAQQALEIVNNLYICTICNRYNPEGKNCGKDNCDW
mgnify:CR=1 FL=1